MVNTHIYSKRGDHLSKFTSQDTIRGFYGFYFVNVLIIISRHQFGYIAIYIDQWPNPPTG